MGWVDNAIPHISTPYKRDCVPIVREAGWAPGPVWTGAENPASTGIRSLDLLARSDYANPAHKQLRDIK